MGYWVASLALIAFGIVGAMSIGRPFLMIGLAMLLLGRLRSRRLVYWPVMLGLVAYNVAYWAIAPAYCSASSTVGGPSSAATCTSLIGIPWPDDATGMNVDTAAFGIANGIAIAAGIATAVFVLYLLRLDRKRRLGSPGGPASAG